MPTRPVYMNRTRFDKLLMESSYDAVIASSFRNVYYLSGALIETIRRIPLRLGLVVWPREGEPVLSVGDIEEGLARRESHLEDVRAYVEFQQSPVDLLVEVLREKGLAGGRLGIEMEHLMAGYYKELVEKLPGAVLEPADRFFDAVRMIKTGEEVQVMTRAAQATERAIQASYQAGRAGMTEKQLGAQLIENLLANGANSIRFLVLGAGENSVFAHHIPTERKLAPGDTIRLDVGGYFDGYASDIARMAFVREPSRAQLLRYQQIYEIHQETLAAVRAGVQARQVYFACQEAFKARGLELKMPHVGHGFGVDGGHEEPLLQPHNETALRPGMVIAVEPVYHDSELGGYHIEDLLRVTEDGCELLSDQVGTAEPVLIPS